MSSPLWLTDKQMARHESLFQKSYGRFRVDDRRVESGMIFTSHNGLRWREAPQEYGPPSHSKPLEAFE